MGIEKFHYLEIKSHKGWVIDVYRKMQRSQEMAEIKSYEKEMAIPPVIKSNYRISARSAMTVCVTVCDWQRLIDNAITL